MPPHTYERLGSPEGELALAQAVLYLAAAPKSNAGYIAYKRARALVQNDGSRPVPLHLRNAPTKLMQQLDYGKGYRYAHDEADGFAAGENYFPEGLQPPPLYEPVARGLEIKIGEKLHTLRQRNDRHRHRHRHQPHLWPKKPNEPNPPGRAAGAWPAQRVAVKQQKTKNCYLLFSKFISH